MSLVLFIFAHIFNRAWTTLTILLGLLVGAFRYDEILYCLGYRTLQHELTALERFRFGVVFMLIVGIALLVNVTTT